MKVETFECSETAAEPIEITEEAIKLIDELNLTGQQNIIKPKTQDTFAKRLAYRQMTQDEVFVYSTLCPEKISLKDYTAGPIPLRVLQIAAHASQLEMFKQLEVWDKKSALVKDPVLVGQFVKDSARDWQITPFILARWGEELETFSTLLNQALKTHQYNLLTGFKLLKSKAESCLRNIESMPLESLQDISVPSCYFPSFT